VTTVSTEASTEAEPSPEERRALFRVVRGTPDDVEIAALTAVLAAVATAGRPEGPPRPASTWATPQARLRRPLTVGPHAWRTSTWPR